MKRTLALIGALALAATAHGQASAKDEAPAAQAEPVVEGMALGHVGFVVSDVDEAVASTIADLRLGDAAKVTKFALTVSEATYLGEPAEFAADFRLVSLPNTQLEYIAPVAGKSPYSDALAEGSEGVVHHLAFYVASIDETVSELREKHPDMNVMLDAKLPGGIGRYAYIEGVIPGTLMELMQMGAAAATAEP